MGNYRPTTYVILVKNFFFKCKFGSTQNLFFKTNVDLGPQIRYCARNYTNTNINEHLFACIYIHIQILRSYTYLYSSVRNYATYI